MVIYWIYVINDRDLGEKRTQEERLVEESQGQKGNFYNRIN